MAKTYAKMGDRVTVHYTGRLRSGAVFDSTDGRAPLEFVVGEGRVLPGFEQAIIGMSPGVLKRQSVPATLAFGPHFDHLVKVFHRRDIDPKREFEVGQQLHVKVMEDVQLLATVTGVDAERVTLDANHPLAGEDLLFEIDLLEIERP